MKLLSQTITLSVRALFSIILLGLIFSQSAHAIKKCQDQDGNWHYGDSSVAACENSKITILNNRGFITEEQDAPKTDEELLAEEKARIEAEEELNQKRAEEDEKLRILGLYDNELDIDRQRDNQLSSVDNNIKVHETYLNNLQKRRESFSRKQAQEQNSNVKESLQASIAETDAEILVYEQELATLLISKDEIIERFSEEKATYLKLKNANQP